MPTQVRGISGQPRSNHCTELESFDRYRRKTRSVSPLTSLMNQLNKRLRKQGTSKKRSSLPTVGCFDTTSNPVCHPLMKHRRFVRPCPKCYQCKVHSETTAHRFRGRAGRTSGRLERDAASSAAVSNTLEHVERKVANSITLMSNTFMRADMVQAEQNVGIFSKTRWRRTSQPMSASLGNLRREGGHSQSRCRWKDEYMEWVR